MVCCNSRNCSNVYSILSAGLICLLVFGVGTLLLVKYKKYIGVFVFYVLFMTVVSAFATEEFFEVDYRFGQRDLVQFAKYAKEKDYAISAFKLNRKYSLLYYNDEKVDFNENLEINLKTVQEDLNKKDNVVVLKNKDMIKIKDKLKYKIIKTGRRYTMIKGIK